MKRPITIFVCLSLLSVIIASTAAYAQIEGGVAPNKILVKLDSSVRAEWAAYQQAGQWTLPSASEIQLHQLNRRYGVKRIRRMFPTTTRFGKAHRRFGLHRWYEITFGDTLTTQVQQLLAQYQNSPAVTLAEPYYLRSFGKRSLPNGVAKNASANDPDFADQWHYHNTGQSGGTPAADINLPAAWTIAQGDSRVIVAVIDGGIDGKHEDLQQALWVNTAEQSGSPGVDDDGNGYVDDIHGYNFGDDRGSIAASEHGTHVAGTVGAVSNNGTGVAGVAGGSGSGDGVRLMSCAVFGTSKQGGFAEAFVYAADHGAVIAQNSWIGGKRSAVLEDAIRYFIERAGYDNSNENFDRNIQLGPMAGGLVVFAAGNDDTENARRAYPASLPEVLTVAATDHHDERSDFSNYGPWIDIAAPGTDILSTTPNDTYGLLSGTSMACPHVSGVAALLVSHYQQPGLSPAHVRTMLLNGATPIDEVNTSYAGKLGRGRLNAHQSFMLDQAPPPGRIDDVTAQVEAYDQVMLTWTASGGDGNTGSAAHYDLRYATFPVTAQNFAQATSVQTERPPRLSGTEDTVVVEGLKASTQYYFALKTRDLLGNISAISNTAMATTPPPPVITVQPTAVATTVEVGKKTTTTLVVANTTGQSTLSFSLAKRLDEPWLKIARYPTTLSAGKQISVLLTIDGRRLTEGVYQETLWVDSNDPATPRIAVPVVVTAVGTPRLAVSHSRIHLEEVWRTTTVSVPLTIRNTGTGTLTITRLAADEAAFQIDTASLLLPPGGHHTATVTFFAELLGTYEGQLMLESDDPRQPSYAIDLRATVVPLPPLAPEPTSLAVELTEGDTIARTIRLRNFSTDTLSWTQTSPQQTAWWQLTPASGQLAPGDTAILRLHLDARQLPVGTHRHTLLFATDDREASVFSFPLTLQVTEKIIPLAITNIVPDQKVFLLDTTYRLDLVAYLPQDVYATATTKDTSAMKVAIDSSTLLLSPKRVGTATVEIRVRDRFDQEAQSSFRVTVIAPNLAPVVKVSTDSVLMVPQEVRIRALAELFTDPDQDTLKYTAESADEGLVRVTVSGSILTLDARASGSTTVLLSATDPSGAQAVFRLPVEVAKVTATEKDVLLAYELTSYPNPSVEQVAVRYTIPEAGWVQLTLHDEYGRLISSLAEQRQVAGKHTLHYRVAGLPAGIYILRLSTGGRRLVRKIVVL